MTPEKAKKAAEVMLAYSRGEKIQVKRGFYDNWDTVEIPSFNWFTYDYRVKPKGEDCGE